MDHITGNNSFSFLLSNSFNWNQRCQTSLYPRPQMSPHQRSDKAPSDSKDEGPRVTSILVLRRPVSDTVRWGSIRFLGPRLLYRHRTSFQCYVGVHLYLLKLNCLCNLWLILVRLLSSECKHSSGHRCLKPYRHQGSSHDRVMGQYGNMVKNSWP